MYITHLCNYIYIYVLKESGEKWSEKLEKKVGRKVGKSGGANDFKGFRHFGVHFFGIWDFAHCSLWHIFGIWIDDFRVLDFEEGAPRVCVICGDV